MGTEQRSLEIRQYLVGPPTMGKGYDSQLSDFLSFSYMGPGVGAALDLMNEKAGWEIGKGLGHIMEVNKKNLPIKPSTLHQDPSLASIGEIDSSRRMGYEA